MNCGGDLLQAKPALEALLELGSTLAVAESLTGGMLSAKIVNVPGASDVFRGGVTVYATASKHEVLGVDKELLDTVGPVDPQVAVQMAQGVRKLFGADWAVSTTGVAGPGDSADGPEGLVYVGVAGPKCTDGFRYRFVGDRLAIREQSVERALRALVDCLKDGFPN